MDEQLNLFDDTFSLEEIFEAYYACRKNKRRTINALEFELDLEKNLILLWKQLNNGTYRIGRSIAFIVTKPVRREVFAADFRDRIVHHLIIRKLMPLFEKSFHPHSFSCRQGKGSLCAIKQAFADIQACSCKYSQKCYVMKLDIQAFFMSIDQRLLFDGIQKLIEKGYHGWDKKRIIELIRQIIFNQPQLKCIRKSPLSAWGMLPAHKSLFHNTPCKGMPIGNLTSQIFANFYLTAFDNFISNHQGLAYERYVDDFMLIHRDKSLLLKLHQQARAFLKKELMLTLHPKKFYLQSVDKGVPFIGAYLKPYRIYVGRRLKNNYISAMHRYKNGGMLPPSPVFLAYCQSVLCSYGGFLKHYACYRLRVKGYRLIAKNIGYLFQNALRKTKFLVFAFLSVPYLKRGQLRRYL